MLKPLRELLNRTLGEVSDQDPGSREHALRLATATLLVEVVRADYREDLIENEAVFRLLRDFFDLTDEETAVLLKEAESEADHAVSLQNFTRLLHERVSLEEKHRILEMLWKTALADKHLDKYEDHLVRKVAGLLYVSHSDLIRIRNQVREAIDGEAGG